MEPARSAEDAPPIQSSERSWPAVITSRNLSIIVIGTVLISAIIKADAKDIPKIVDSVFTSHAWANTGWILAATILLVSVVFFRVLMRLNDREVNRLAKERDELQRILLNRQDLKT